MMLQVPAQVCQFMECKFRLNNQLLSDYMTTSPKQFKVENVPVSGFSEINAATISDTIGKSAKYAARTNPGAVVNSYGSEELLQVLAKANGPNDILELCITQVPNDDREIYTKAMFGFELLHEKASTFDNHIHYVSRCILKKASLSECTSVRQKSQTEVIVAGRIECDADARLNSKSVVLQGTWEESLSQAVAVDIDNLKYSLFPGQVVVMRGLNPRGDKFVAQEVYCDASQAIPDQKRDMMNTLKGNLSIVMAAGPYTTSENLAYEPLKDLITYISTQKPHVVILTGPFIDCDHTNVKDNVMTETFKSLFDKLIDTLGELYTTSPFTKIYIVSNCKDVFHLNIYPTPPYPSSKRKHPNIHFLPDPCTLNLSGVVVGITGIDVLMHISQEEISQGVGGDKLARLANHLLMQQTYYPLWPPPPGLCLDAALWSAHAQMPCTPHILVLPSNFRYFIKEINGCVVVNPERLSKGQGGGTFAKAVVSNDTASPKNIAAQIIRI
ncbi:DNA polymerase alpha subunit B isoform X2 [Battus philenor]|uniref:DNA polymerase alpha subunit B isoform X2 n=1 Tax=Battus philenor TaxID=42288 RepID=UPI0035D083AA